jgi:hypothetical protein
MPANARQFIAVAQLQSGRGFIALPFDPDDAWGERATHHVSGLVNGAKIRGPLASFEGGPALMLPPGWLRDNPISEGTALAIELWPEGPQLDALPEDIAAALAGSPRASAFFESLATFYRKAYLTWLAGSARRPEVRRERLAQFISLLEAGRKERPR